jgi:hypothetical protein
LNVSRSARTRFAFVAARRALGGAQGVELRAREEIFVAPDDLRLLRGLLLAHANGARFLGPLVEVALEALLELVGCADGHGRHVHKR